MMTAKKTSKLLGALLLIVALSFSTNSYASTSFLQDNDSDSSDSSASSDSSSSDSGSSDDPKGGTDVPLDGGLSILLLGAAAFGIKKLRDNK